MWIKYLHHSQFPAVGGLASNSKKFLKFSRCSQACCHLRHACPPVSLCHFPSGRPWAPAFREDGFPWAALFSEQRSFYAVEPLASLWSVFLTNANPLKLLFLGRQSFHLVLLESWISLVLLTSCFGKISVISLWNRGTVLNWSGGVLTVSAIRSQSPLRGVSWAWDGNNPPGLSAQQSQCLELNALWPLSWNS